MGASASWCLHIKLRFLLTAALCLEVIAMLEMIWTPPAGFGSNTYILFFSLGVMSDVTHGAVPPKHSG